MSCSTDMVPLTMYVRMYGKVGASLQIFLPTLFIHNINAIIIYKVIVPNL